MNTQENAELLSEKLRVMCAGFTGQVALSSLLWVAVETFAKHRGGEASKENLLSEIGESFDFYKKQQSAA